MRKEEMEMYLGLPQSQECRNKGRLWRWRGWLGCQSIQVHIYRFKEVKRREEEEREKKRRGGVEGRGYAYLVAAMSSSTSMRSGYFVHADSATSMSSWAPVAEGEGGKGKGKRRKEEGRNEEQDRAG